MINQYPHELQLGDVYITPVIVVLALGFFSALFTGWILNKTKLARYFYITEYVFLAIMVLYVILIDKFLIRF
jgi:hypothetical protein